MDLRRRPDRPARPDRGRRVAVHRPLPEGDLRLRHGDEPLVLPRRRLRDADDRRLPAVPPGHGRPGIGTRYRRARRHHAQAGARALMSKAPPRRTRATARWRRPLARSVAVGGVVAAGVALLRARSLSWGATDEELNIALPGDELVPD